MNIKDELVKRLDEHGYKLNDEGNIVIKFSELDDDVIVTVEKLILKISNDGIDAWWEGTNEKGMCLMISSFKGFLSRNAKDFREIAGFFDPENVSKVMELLKLTHDILAEITSETLISEPQNEIPKRYQTQSGKNFIDVLRNEMMSHERFLGFLEGNVYKYVFRYRNKGGKKDLRKAKHYLDLLEAEIDE